MPPEVDFVVGIIMLVFGIAVAIILPGLGFSGFMPFALALVPIVFGGMNIQHGWTGMQAAKRVADDSKEDN